MIGKLHSMFFDFAYARILKYVRRSSNHVCILSHNDQPADSKAFDAQSMSGVPLRLS
jgi:hypothetical protein